MKQVTYYTNSDRAGFDLHDALRDVCSQLEPGSYLEIGVHGGGSLTTVLTFAAPKRLTLADIWDPAYCGHGLLGHHHIVQLLAELAYVGDVRYLDGDSKQTLPTLAEDDRYDMILVDGDHSPAGAIADLTAAWPHLQPGGALLMDDIRHPSYPGLLGVFRRFRDSVGAIEVPQTLGAPSNAGVLLKPIPPAGN